MGAEDWYRNSNWTPWARAAFERTLARKRDKGQYLRIQAGALTQTNPRAALSLLDRYLELDQPLDYSRAWIDQSDAYLTLGEVDLAIGSLRKAAEHELAQDRGIRAGGPVAFARLVAVRRRQDLYPDALAILDADTARRRADTLPVEQYRRHGTRALLLAALGRQADAAGEARTAVRATMARTSGLWKHPGLGLVGPTLDGFGRRVRAIAFPRVSAPVRLLVGMGWVAPPLPAEESPLP